MTILPLTYLGNVDYFSRLAAGDVVVDLGENYVKQTFRNRCEILTAGGVAALTVNVVAGGSKNKAPVRDMRIDYSKRWQHQHWMSLCSAYRNSPYFDHYADRFEPYYRKPFTFLADLNIGLMQTVLDILAVAAPSFSDTYIEPSPGDVDLRGAFDPALRSSDMPFPPYCQVFADRFPFQPNLSVVDLIFCEGPHASAFRSTLF